MKIFLTVSVDQLELDKNELIGFRMFNFGDVYVKYEISIMDDEKYANRQKYLSEEISLINEDLIIFGNPCYDLNDVLNLISELKKYNKSITRIYIPSDFSINSRKKKAYKEHIHWNRLLGTSDEEIEKNFNDFRTTLKEIKEGLKNTSIEIKAV